MAGKTTLNASRVGLLVLVFIVAILYGLHFLGTSFGGQTLHYSIDTQDATGIAPGSNVLLAGVPVGQVKQVTLQSPATARITVVMKENEALPQGAVALFPSSLTGFGDNYIQIVKLKAGSGSLPSGSVIEGYRQGPLDSFLPNAKTTVEELNKTLASANALLSDKKLKDGLTNLMQSGNRTLDHFSALAAQTQTMMAQNQAQIANAISNASEAMENVRQGTQMVVSLLKKGDYQKESMALLKSLNATGAKAQKLIDNLNALASDPNLKSGIDQTLKNTAALTEQGNKIAKSVQTIAENGAKVSHEAIGLTKNANDVAVEAKTLVKKVTNLVDKVSIKVDHFAPKASIGKITAETDLYHEGRPNHWRTDFNFMVPISHQNLYLGVYDAFGSNRLNLQLGKSLSPDLLLRYGAYAGKLGLGVNYALGPRFGFVGDVFDINNPTLNFGAQYEFGNGFIGFLGYDQLFERNRLTLGVGYRQ